MVEQDPTICECIQLVLWIFYGKYGYLIQSIVIPHKTIRRIQSIDYNFIWRIWKEVAFQCCDGGVDLKDFVEVQMASIVVHE